MICLGCGEKVDRRRQRTARCGTSSRVGFIRNAACSVKMNRGFPLIWSGYDDYSRVASPDMWVMPHALYVWPVTDLAVISLAIFLMSGLRRICRWLARKQLWLF